ncbi:MAG: VWA domain-containing protein, partial [Planctomycetes bacterium]|nr:VWA domain-containing protein [Planctomycetota bacterium]
IVLDTSGSMDFGSGGLTKIEYARRLAGALSYLAALQGDAVGLSCVANGIVRNVPPRRSPAHLATVYDILEKAHPQNDTQLPTVLHELAETIRQRALIVIISDFFVEPELMRSCLQHLQFRKHDVAAMHLLDQQEIEFNFRRPMRFLDLEGGPAIFAEPNEIAERYLKVLGEYLTEIKKLMLESAIDYHRITIDEDYEKVLTRFLVGRTRTKGGRA